MFNLDTFTTLIIAIAPAVSSILTVIGGFIAITRKANNKISKTEEEANRKVAQTQRDISIIKSKLASIEIALEEKER